MREIVNIRCNNEEFHIKINGSNIDLLSAMAHIIKTMERESDVPIEVSLRYLKGYLEDDKE